MKDLGITLFIVGIIIMITKFDFVTHKKSSDLNTIQVRKKENHSTQWPLITGGVFLLSGFALVSANTNKKQLNKKRI